MIIIIGAGIAGLSLGYALIKSGQEVTILEASGIASGASGVATSYLEPRLGNTAMRLIERESMARWESFANELQAQSNIDVGFQKAGQLKVTLAEHIKKFEKDLKARTAQQVPFERLTIADARRMEPALSPDLDAAAFLPEVRWVTGSKVCQALAFSIKKMGGKIFEQARVARMSFSGTSAEVHTQEGQGITGDAIVLCNGIGDSIIEGLPNDIPKSRAVRGVNLIVDQSELNTPISHLIKHHRGNLCPRDNNQLIVGTTYEADVTGLNPDQEVVEFLYQNAEPILPAVRSLPLIKVTAGLRSKVGDGNLRLGRSGENPAVYFSLSHGGAGYLRAPVVSDELATFIITGHKGNLTQHHTSG